MGTHLRVVILTLCVLVNVYFWIANLHNAAFVTATFSAFSAGVCAVTLFDLVIDLDHAEGER